MHILSCYERLPIAFQSGSGIWLMANGQQYLDALSGIGVTILGHAHPKVTAAICEQAATLIHCSNLYRVELQEQLAAKLVAMADMAGVFFSNSGAEANEGAIKLARLYSHKVLGQSEPQLLVVEGGYYGRTLATLSASSKVHFKEGYAPLMPGFITVPYNNTAAVEALFKQSNVVGIMLEPILGQGGIIIPDANYLITLQALCAQYNKLLILDEVQTGLGRTGALFNYQLHNIKPDIVTVAKGLANGVPIGATLCNEKLRHIFTPGKHGSTFGGNPLASKAALATLEELSTNKWWQNAQAMGNSIKEELQQAFKNNDLVVEVRGQGLMLGIELTENFNGLEKLGLEQHILFNVTGKVLRLLPPLIINQSETELLISKIIKTVTALKQKL